MKKFLKSDLTALLNLLSEKERVYLPVSHAGQTNYAIYNENSRVDLDTLKTVKSAKEVFFPQSETLYTVTRQDKKIRITQEELENEDFVLFGVRGCDVKGIEVLDRVFLSEPVDSFYKARRDHGIIVSFACNEPEESCFCKAFGIDCAEPAGDVTLYDCGDYYFWNAKTEKGEALTEKCASLLSDADEAPVKEKQEEIRKITGLLPYMNISLDSWHGEATAEKFNSPVWADLYKPCIGCGRCAEVCHARLLPYEIVRRLENMHYERLQHLSPADCDGCSACSYVCPAGRDVAADVLKAGETKGMYLTWGEDDNE